MALSMDLRVRVLAAIDEGLSCRAAAVRFGVAPSTASRWFGQRRETGNLAPKPRGGDMRSRRVEERAGTFSPFGKRARTFRLKNCAWH